MARSLGSRRDLPLRPHQDPRRDLLDRHTAADGERHLAPRARVLVQPHRHGRPLPTDAGQRGLLPDGVGRQRSQRRAAGPAHDGRPVRPVAALRPRLHPAEKVKKGDRPIPISRPNFVEICEEVVEELEQSYFDLWSTVGLSVDWTQTYTTIGPKATRVSQRAFLRLLDRDLVYRSGAPTLWDVDMRTAVAQAELEDREDRRRLPQAPVHRSRRQRPVHRHDPARAAARRASRSSPIPTTSAISRCSARRRRRRCSASRCRSSRTSWPSPTRAPASP